MPYAASLSATETAQFTCFEEQGDVVNSINFWHQNWVERAMCKLNSLNFSFFICKIRMRLLLHRVVISTNEITF